MLHFRNHKLVPRALLTLSLLVALPLFADGFPNGDPAEVPDSFGEAVAISRTAPPQIKHYATYEASVNCAPDANGERNCTGGENSSTCFALDNPTLVKDETLNGFHYETNVYRVKNPSYRCSSKNQPSPSDLELIPKDNGFKKRMNLYKGRLPQEKMFNIPDGAMVNLPVPAKGYVRNYAEHILYDPVFGNHYFLTIEKSDDGKPVARINIQKVGVLKDDKDPNGKGYLEWSTRTDIETEASFQMDGLTPVPQIFRAPIAPSVADDVGTPVPAQMTKETLVKKFAEVEGCLPPDVDKLTEDMANLACKTINSNASKSCAYAKFCKAKPNCTVDSCYRQYASVMSNVAKLREKQVTARQANATANRSVTAAKAKCLTDENVATSKSLEEANSKLARTSKALLEANKALYDILDANLQESESSSCTTFDLKKSKEQAGREKKQDRSRVNDYEYVAKDFQHNYESFKSLRESFRAATNLCGVGGAAPSAVESPKNHGRSVNADPHTGGSKIDN